MAQDQAYADFLKSLEQLHGTVLPGKGPVLPNYSEEGAAGGYDFQGLYKSPDRARMIRESIKPDGSVELPAEFKPKGELESFTTDSGQKAVSRSQRVPVTNTEILARTRMKGVADWWDEFKWHDVVPFAAAGFDVADAAKLHSAAQDVEKNGRAAKPENFDTVLRFLADSQRETTVSYDFLSIVKDLPAFALEFAATSGLVSLGKTAAKKAVMSGIGKGVREAVEASMEKRAVGLGMRAAGRLGRVADVIGTAGAQSLLMPWRAQASAYQRALPAMGSIENAERATIVFEGTARDFEDAIGEGRADMWIEALSESLGDKAIQPLIAKLPLVNKLGALQGAVFSRWAANNPTVGAQVFLKEIARPGGWGRVLAQAGLQDPLTEVAEERAGDLMRAAFLGDELAAPTARQLLTEMAAFAVPGVAIASVQRKGLEHAAKDGNINLDDPGAESDPAPADASGEGVPDEDGAAGEVNRSPEPNAAPDAVPAFMQPGESPSMPSSAHTRSTPKDFSSVLYREMSLGGFQAITGQVNTSPQEMFFSTTPELALGQGSNKGVLVQMRSEKMPADLSARAHAKPGIEVVDGAEIAVKGRSTPKELFGAVDHVLFKNDLKVTAVERRTIKQTKTLLEKAGFTKQATADGELWSRLPVASASASQTSRDAIFANLDALAAVEAMAEAAQDETNMEAQGRRLSDAVLEEVVKYETGAISKESFDLNIQALHEEARALGMGKEYDELRASIEAEDSAGSEDRLNDPLQGNTRGGGLGRRKLPAGATIPPTNISDEDALKEGERITAELSKPFKGPKVSVQAGDRVVGRTDRGARTKVSIDKLRAAYEKIVKVIHGQSTIRVGRLGTTDALGWFNTRGHQIRIRDADSIATMAHEIGHAVQAALGRAANKVGAMSLRGLPASVKRELNAGGMALYGPIPPHNGFASEGWAEFFRALFTNPEELENYKATLEWVSHNIVAGRPELESAIQAARGLTEEWLDAGDIERARSEMEAQDTAHHLWPRLKRYLSDKMSMLTDWVDSAAPLVEVDRTVEEWAFLDAHTRWTEAQIRRIEREEAAARKEKGKKRKKDQVNDQGGIELANVPTELEGGEIDPLENAPEPKREDYKLSPSKSLKDTHDYLNMTHSARAAYMAETAMIDITGQVVEGVKPLRELSKLIKPKEWVDFAVYLWARRAIALASTGREGGMRSDAAKRIITEFHQNELVADRFMEAAILVHRWNDAVLDYAAKASDQMAVVVERIRKSDPGQYVPLWRAIEQVETAFAGMGAGSMAGRTGSIAKRLKGSLRGVRNPLSAMQANAEKIIKATHDRVLLERMLVLRNIPGLGWLIEEVPADIVAKHITTMGALVTRIREALGVKKDEPLEVMSGDGEAHDIEDLLDMGELVKFFAPTFETSRNEVIFTMVDPKKKGGGIRQFVLKDRNLYRALLGATPTQADNLFAAMLKFHTRLWRMSTVAWRFSFGYIANPSRDVSTAWIQTRAKERSAATFAFDLLGMLASAPFYYATRENLRARKAMPKWMRDNIAWLDFFVRQGGEMSQPVGTDINYQNRTAARVVDSKIKRLISPRNWLDLLAAAVQIPETSFRAQEVKAVARRMGLRPEDPLTMDQAMQLARAGSEVTVNFRRGGFESRRINQYSPFFTARINGLVDMHGAYKRDPVSFFVRGVTSITIPAVIAYLLLEDEDWFDEIPVSERYGYTFIKANDETVMRLRLPHEYGSIFSALPVALIDSAKGLASTGDVDLEALGGLLHSIRQQLTPDPPPLIAEIGEQLANHDMFFNRDIVSKRESRLPAPEQFGPYTTSTAKFLGDLTGLSPKRIDHAIAGILGQAAYDLVDAYEAIPKALSGAGSVEGLDEPAEIPILGTLYRRGGTEVSRSKTVDLLYSMKEQADLIHASGVSVETESQRQRRLLVTDAARSISLLSWVRAHAKTADQRRAVSRQILDVARLATKAYSEKTYMSNNDHYLRQLMRNRVDAAEAAKARLGGGR